MTLIKRISGFLVILSVFSAVSVPAVAEDIDLFLNGPPRSEASPNILFILDNSAHWSQDAGGSPVFTTLRKALTDLLEVLRGSDRVVNVGFMLYTETGTPNNDIAGGYLRAAIRPMQVDPDTGEDYIAIYQDLLNSLGENKDKATGAKAGLAMAEAYRYFIGGEPRSGNEKVKADIGGSGPGAPNTDSWTEQDAAVRALPGNALAMEGSPTYTSPRALYAGEGCDGDDYIIFISNGVSSENDDDITISASMLKQANGGVSVPGIPVFPGSQADNMSDEWARFLNEVEGIKTFTIDVEPKSKGRDPGWAALLESMADQGGGEYYRVESNSDSGDEIYAGMREALGEILSRIIARSSVFASVALPRSAKAQSTFINQVYLGQFRPDGSAGPRWVGNMKQYKLGYIGDSLRLLDADDKPAVDSTTGFITPCARSYWTPKTSDSYWDYPGSDARGDCIAVPGSELSNSPDGPVVEKGGQAYVLRSSVSRTMYTCSPASGTVCTGNSVMQPPKFEAANMELSRALLKLPASATPADRSRLIQWAFGLDTDNENGPLALAPDLSEVRPSVHGDVVHTQPVAIDYAGNPADPDIVVFYGGNDGLLRAINGNRSRAYGGVPAGGEYWSFLPPQFYGSLKRLHDGAPAIRYPASGLAAPESTATNPVETKDYGFDGPVTAFEGDISGTTERFIYAAMRRGGRVLYAFDVTDITRPKLRWALGCPSPDDDMGCSSPNGVDVSGIGQTWSEASIARQDGRAGPLLIMGGGYDECEDFDGGAGAANHRCSIGGYDVKGDSVFIIDGESGGVLNVLPTERPVVGRVTVVPTSDLDPGIAYAYAVDTGGNVYRISAGTLTEPAPIGRVSPARWVIRKIASLGCASEATDCTANRKFLFGPDIVRVPLSSRLAILVGSGDREKPLSDYEAAGSVQNYFFTVFDVPSDPGWFDDGCMGGVVCLASLTEVTSVKDGPSSGLSHYGWALKLRAGEQVVSGAVTIADVVNFSTHIPAGATPGDGSCAAELGTATTYNIRYARAQGATVDLVGGGLAPTPVAGKVILDNGEIVPFCIGCGGEESFIGGGEVMPGTDWTQPVSRVYWELRQ